MAIVSARAALASERATMINGSRISAYCYAEIRRGQVSAFDPFRTLANRARIAPDGMQFSKSRRW
jgi:hypothetical protein